MILRAETFPESRRALREQILVKAERWFVGATAGKSAPGGDWRGWAAALVPDLPAA